MEPIRIVIEIKMKNDGTSTAMAFQENAGQITIQPGEVPPHTVEYRLLCLRWDFKIGKKPARSCKGCTVGCPGKGQYNGEPMEIPPKLEGKSEAQKMKEAYG